MSDTKPHALTIGNGILHVKYESGKQLDSLTSAATALNRRLELCHQQYPQSTADQRLMLTALNLMQENLSASHKRQGGERKAKQLEIFREMESVLVD